MLLLRSVLLVLVLGLLMVLLQLLSHRPRTLSCMVPHLATSKACAYSSPACGLVAPLVFCTNWVLLVIATMLTLSLGIIHYHFICTPSLPMWALLILRYVLLALATSMCSAFGLVVRVIGMLAL